MLLRRSLPVIALPLALALGACGGSDDGGEQEATPTPTQAAAAAERVGCREVAAPKPKPEAAKTGKPGLKLEGSKTWLATVATSCGEFTITLDVERAPKTSSAFAGLAREGFFDDLTFHRISKGFVIQGGDPLGTGMGGPDFSVREAPPQDLAYSRGIVAMAKTGAEPPGTSGSQFFVVTAEDTPLPPDYALLGEVTDGMDTVDAIAAVDIDPATEAPVSPIVIDSVEISEG
jgi:peptidyl-prolyl cis-trans isomerase B (cyclophilin B)